MCVKEEKKTSSVRIYTMNDIKRIDERLKKLEEYLNSKV